MTFSPHSGPLPRERESATHPSARSASRIPWQRLLLPVIALAFLWFTLIRQLAPEWSLNPQYNYGWAIPFLCLYLLWQNRAPENASNEYQISLTKGSMFDVRCSMFDVAFGALAFLYLPTRLIQEANPEWRFIGWALAIEVLGLTLLAIRYVAGDSVIKSALFPICFFLVAVPWPTVIESPLIRGLTSGSASATVEILGWLGIPAVQRGFVIEIATGVVGIDEACSGIRSLQATLMLSLFFGELYRLTIGRRVALLCLGFIIAYLLNVARTLLLVAIGARKGIASISAWHDPAGITILLLCFFILWAIAWSFGKRLVAETTASPSPSFQFRSNAPLVPFAVLIAWLLTVELSVHGWYRSHETKFSPAATWSVSWPDDNPTLRQISLPEANRRLLHYDDAKDAAWNEEGVRWQAIFLRWKPGRAALHLAKGHTPEICLTATGRQLVSNSEVTWVEANGLRLPFLCYAVTNEQPPLHVFYCLWDDRRGGESFVTTSLTYENRLKPVLAGQRNPGQRSLEVAVWGFGDLASAQAALARQLPRLIRVNSDSKS